LGVAVAIAGILAFVLSSRLSDRKDAAFAKFQEESKVSIAASDARAAEALAGAAAANERAGRVELEAVQQRERAAVAELQLLELKQRLAPRRLSSPQREAIISTARQPGQPILEVLRLGDAEDKQLADDLIDAFGKAGWTIRVTDVGLMAPPIYGLLYNPAHAHPSSGSGDVLSDALKKARLRFEQGRPLPNPKIAVGLKPIE
jgi:hypothetical protein